MLIFYVRVFIFIKFQLKRKKFWGKKATSKIFLPGLYNPAGSTLFFDTIIGPHTHTITLLLKSLQDTRYDHKIMFANPHASPEDDSSEDEHNSKGNVVAFLGNSTTEQSF